MTITELHRNFKLEADKLDMIASMPSFLPEEIDYFYNTAIERIVKTRYSGLNVHKDGFQQNQKRTDDLRTLVNNIEPIKTTIAIFDRSVAYSIGAIVTGVSTNIYNVYRCSAATTANTNFDPSKWKLLDYQEYSYPENYWIGLGEYVKISYYDKKTNSIKQNQRIDIIECTIENIDSNLNNNLSDHLFNHGKAKPLRLYNNNKIYLYVDGTYAVSEYGISYIKSPDKIEYYKFSKFDPTIPYTAGRFVRYNGDEYICKTGGHSAGAWNSSHFEKYYLETMPDHMWDEITVTAVRLALENISDGRYQTYSQESQVIE